jgi:hypothetical protein
MDFGLRTLAKDTERYYERLTDIERKAEVKMTRTPALKIGWPGGGLTRDVLRNVQVALGQIVNLGEIESVGFYLNGLATLANINIHFQVEPSHSSGSMTRSGLQ